MAEIKSEHTGNAPRSMPAREGIRATNGVPFETEGESYLQIIPADPHRLLAYWHLSPGLLRHARRTVRQARAHDRLILRLFRLRYRNENLSQAKAQENFALDVRQNRTNLTLVSPGGFVAAALGVQDRSGRFFPLIRSSRVALPTAPEPTQLASAPRPRGDLEEQVILARTTSANLPPELLNLPETAGPQHGGSPEVPATPTLDERGVVAAALTARNEEESGQAPPAAGTAFATAAYREFAPPSSHDCGGTGSEPGAAPIALQARLSIQAFVREGERVAIDGVTVENAILGSEVWSKCWTDFSTAWTLLHENGPSTLPHGAPLRFTIEIEGLVRDPEYLSRLPRHVSVDTSGRFRTARLLPDDHPILPEWRIEPLDSSAA